jgi:glutamine amidotransferase PdxT
MALTFHPELTLDRRFHRWLLTEAERCKGER